MNKYVIPDWPAVANVNAASTTRLGGLGEKPYDSFNLGVHVGEKIQTVEANRALLLEELALPANPTWLNQVHGTEVVYCDHNTAALTTADAAWTDQPGCVLAVMTADCLPVLLSANSGRTVAVVHGGWRGLVDGILEKTLAELPVDTSEIQAWLGPAIGPSNFEVGSDVLEAFLGRNPAFETFFSRSLLNSEKYYADLFEIGKFCLQSAGLTQVFGGGVCTFADQARFFSHRRDQGVTGRMASLIWISE